MHVSFLQLGFFPVTKMLSYSCDRSSCPAVEKPQCDVGEKLQVINPGDCCSQYQCVCDVTTCPARQTQCSYGHRLKVCTLKLL